jgi:HK97 family phage major capsid protein
MKKCNICGFEYEGDSCPVCARAKALSEEKERSATARVNDILAMGKKHDLMDDAQRFIAEGKSVQEFKDLVIDTMATKQATTTVTMPDQPVYKGSAATAFGMQILDARIMSKTSDFPAEEVRQARTRMEQTQKRNIMMIEERLRKENRAAASGGFTLGVPSDGGMFLQGETAMELMTHGFNNSEVLSRCQPRTLSPGTQFVEIYGIDEESRVEGERGGGVRVYNNKELGEYTASKIRFGKVRIEPNKLTGLYYASGEVWRNVTFIGQEMRQLFAEEFAYKCQKLVIRGSGAGEPLGVLSADCLITQAKKSGQLADTIVTENILHMEKSIWRESPGLCYLVNRETKPQLSALSLSVGTGGALVPLYQTQFYEGNRMTTLNGLPCITIEQCSALGDVGDIILFDGSQYITANKGDIMEAMSIEYMFIYDQNTVRFTFYFDGQPRWTSSITPEYGAAGAKVGPFVTLAARA